MQLVPVTAVSPQVTAALARVERAYHYVDQSFDLHGPVFGRVVGAARTDAKAAVELLASVPEQATVAPSLELVRTAVDQLADARLAGQPSAWLDRAYGTLGAALDQLRVVATQPARR